MKGEGHKGFRAITEVLGRRTDRFGSVVERVVRMLWVLVRFYEKGESCWVRTGRKRNRF